MEEFQRCREEAEKRLKVADHLLNVTHSLVKDPKLLTTVLENLYRSFEGGMNSVLEYEALFKNISVLPESFEPRFQVFQEVAENHGIERGYVEKLRQLRDIMGLHKESPVEFSRGEKFVIADEDYSLETLTKEDIKKDVLMAKEFLAKVDEVVSENERIFG